MSCFDLIASIIGVPYEYKSKGILRAVLYAVIYAFYAAYYHIWYCVDVINNMNGTNQLLAVFGEGGVQRYFLKGLHPSL